MSLPPSPNPGGQNRRLARNAIADWLTASTIPGLTAAASRPVGEVIDWGETPDRPDGAAQVFVVIPREREERVAGVGPTNRGGKMMHFDVELDLWHVWHENDAADSEDDYDRIVDAIKDALRGVGRDLGRPEVVLQIGEWPRETSIDGEHDEPVWSDGAILRHGTLSFVYSQYMQQQP